MHFVISLTTKICILLSRLLQLCCDSRVAINIAYNPVQHDQTKHVEIDQHFIKEKLQAGIICAPYVKAMKQLDDILTKAVSSSVFHAI
jgi:hypothetical protein